MQMNNLLPGYYKIQTNKGYQLTDKTFYFKLEKYWHEQSSASVIIEISDWVGQKTSNVDLFIDNKRLLSFGYSGFVIIESSEEEFNQELMKELEHTVRTKMLKNQDSFCIFYKNTTERSTYLKKLLDLIKYYERDNPIKEEE